MTDPQLFLSPTRPKPELVDEIENPESPTFPKPDGGIWTSPLRREDPPTSGWTEWCRREQYGDSEQRAWKLIPESGCTLYTVGSEEQLLDLYGEFGIDNPSVVCDQQLDFEAVAQSEYDGIYLTPEGQQETRFSPINLYGWDCECVLFFDWCFAAVEDLGTMSLDS